jgi:hypothetical protein
MLDLVQRLWIDVSQAAQPDAAVQMFHDSIAVVCQCLVLHAMVPPVVATQLRWTLPLQCFWMVCKGECAQLL